MKKLTGWRLTVVRVLVLLLVVGLTVFLFINRDRVKELEALGYPGVFLVSLLANATLILPVPGVLFTSAMGAVFNPYLVALAAGTGATLGELTGYMAGFSGQGVIENRKWYDKVTSWMTKYGGITVLVLAFIPNPVFDIAGMVAGALRMPMWKYLIFSWIGQVGKMLLFALGRAELINLFL
ncbi:MAG TPA: VTT domain-containing protein [Anaerolineaceae bacterium]|nr:VTT domain-containing protein [Anaerolineaceae bacterium]